MRQLLKTKLVDMDLSVRALNCLKAAEVDTLGIVVQLMGIAVPYLQKLQKEGESGGNLFTNSSKSQGL